jgi:hypothetical protein
MPPSLFVVLAMQYYSRVVPLHINRRIALSKAATPINHVLFNSIMSIWLLIKSSFSICVLLHTDLALISAHLYFFSRIFMSTLMV